jgi:hypothetical protein
MCLRRVRQRASMPTRCQRVDSRGAGGFGAAVPGALPSRRGSTGLALDSKPCPRGTLTICGSRLGTPASVTTCTRPGPTDSGRPVRPICASSSEPASRQKHACTLLRPRSAELTPQTTPRPIRTDGAARYPDLCFEHAESHPALHPPAAPSAPSARETPTVALDYRLPRRRPGSSDRRSIGQPHFHPPPTSHQPRSRRSHERSCHSREERGVRPAGGASASCCSCRVQPAARA